MPRVEGYPSQRDFLINASKIATWWKRYFFEGDSAFSSFVTFYPRLLRNFAALTIRSVNFSLLSFSKLSTILLVKI